MRIVFFGASELGWQCCRTLLDLGEKMVGIVTMPAQFRISWSADVVKNARHRSFSDLAERYGVPLLNLKTNMQDKSCYEQVEAWKPDLLVVVGWYYMVGKAYRALADLGAVGIHASILPAYRGGAPLVWAMIRGEVRSGVTLFQLDSGVDSGPVLGTKQFPIEVTDYISDVIEKATSCSVKLIAEEIPRLRRGEAFFQAQNHSLASNVPQRKPEDGFIDWSVLSSEGAYNWIRAQSHPYPGAFTRLNGRKLTIWRSTKTDHAVPYSPGTAFSENAYVYALCADLCKLRIDECTWECNNGDSNAELLTALADGPAAFA